MLKENLIMLRNMHGFSQEEIAEKINISRQAYAKWENGTTVPDIEKCMRLAELYGVTIDSLIKTETIDGQKNNSACAKRQKYLGFGDNQRARTACHSQSRP